MLRIRQAGLSDAGVLTQLRCAFLEEELHQELPDGFADQLRGWIEEAMPEGRLLSWLAELDGRVVGCVAVHPYSHLPSAYFRRGVGWYVLNMYVRPGHRRQGLANALLAAVGAAARDREIDSLNLHSTAEAHCIYERFGFGTSVDAMNMTLHEGVAGLSEGEPGIRWGKSG
ncbi:MAG TPA: GNAT family N-acetyltransferase [Dyella sp.]|uniref:GNAT family N-acetyltransferase n=1 Tax=Dyella sp. TaxID=1869338 RepID=UPI002D794432|nr:GNAT family N-acetyltransferase [Dyella sp.]HET6555554.1 GNAT family N-acetyltransferase [Dyella sp.]